MKKHIKIIFSTILALTILVSVFALNVSAASISVSGGEYEVGQKVSVTVSYEGDAALISVLVSANYDTKVLRFDNISGVKADDVNASGGSVKFIDEDFSNGSKKGSYILNFTAIAEGSANISVSATGSDGEGEFPASKTAAIKVAAPKPSSNANLSSIKLSAGALSPAFDPNKTEYSATVKYNVDSITITGAVADGKSSYTGGGTFGLEVGDNERVLTVTAQDGTKKTYILKIKRMSEEETLAAEEEARNANPLLAIIDGVDYTIVDDLSSIAIPTGYKQDTATRKETEIPVLKDENGEYTLYWLVDAQGENGAFYTRDENDNFTRISCVVANNKLYIIEEPDIEREVTDEYVKSTRTIDGIDVGVYNFTDEELKDFCVLKCYVDGKRAYYCFDTVEGTMQRATGFYLAIKQASNDDTVVADPKPEGKFDWFKNMTKVGKAVFLIVVFVAVAFIAAAVLVIIKMVSTNQEELYDDYMLSSNDDFILNDFAEETIEDVVEDEQVTEENDMVE